jgi:hypothetical protein
LAVGSKIKKLSNTPNERADVIDFDKELEMRQCSHMASLIDFLGVFQNDDLWLIEVKNASGYMAENLEKLAGKDPILSKKIAANMKDSIALIVGRGYTSVTKKGYWERISKLLTDNSKPINVLLWLEMDTLPRPQLNIILSTMRNQLSRKLNWLTPNVFVWDIHTLENSAPLKTRNDFLVVKIKN